MKIRLAKIEELESVHFLDSHITHAMLRKCIENEQEFVLINEEDKIVAVLRYTMFWQSIPFLDLIFIIDDYRNKGYGRKMMNYWEERMKLLGYKYVMTSTQADETAFAFYERLGYEKTGAFYPPDQTAEELIYLKGI